MIPARAAILFLAATAASTFSPVIIPNAVFSRLPFDFALASEDEPRFAEPDRFESGGVPVRLLWNARATGKSTERIDLFQQRSPDGAWPQWKWVGARTTATGFVRLAASPGLRSIAVWRRAGDAEGRYQASPVFVWPSTTPDLELDRERVRTLRGEAVSRGSAGVIFVGSPSTRDPLCEAGGQKWQCVTTALTAGVVVLCDGGGQRRSAAVTPTQWGDVPLERSDWAALIAVETAGGAQEPAPVSFTMSASANENGQIRSSEPARTDRLGSLLYWVRSSLGSSPRLIAHRGRQVGMLEGDELAAAECGQPLHLPLVDARSIRGRVQTESGAPLGHASVLLLEEGPARPSDSEPAPPVLAASTLADEEGRFAFDDEQPRPLRVRGCHPTAGCAEREVPEQESEIDLVVEPRWRFSGRLVSRSGVPQPQAHLRILPTLEHYGSARDRLLILPTETDAQSDQDGRFEIAPAAVGSYFLEARQERVGSARRAIDVTELTPSRTDVGDIVLAGAGGFLARVDAANCAGGSLALSGPVAATSLPAIRDFPLDPGGLIAIDLPEGGTWLVWARCGGQRRDVDPTVLPDVESLYGSEVRLIISPARPAASPEVSPSPR